MKLCYIGRVPTNWWPRGVLCALWTRRPIVKVAMGCRTEPAAVHIAHVLQRLDFFQFFNFFYNLHDLQQKKKNYTTYSKKKKIQFFFIIHTTYSKKKKITRIYSKKKKLHDCTVFLYTTYIFHCATTSTTDHSHCNLTSPNLGLGLWRD